MMCFSAFISGIVNGIFSSGAGQILVFVLIYLLKNNTYSARATILLCTTITTFVTTLLYFRSISVDLIHLLISVLCGGIFGFIGSKIMPKINSNILNLISGIVITIFSFISIMVMK